MATVVRPADPAKGPARVRQRTAASPARSIKIDQDEEVVNTLNYNMT